MPKATYMSKASERKGPRYVSATLTFQVAEDIMPIADLKANLSEVVRGLDARPRPLVITLNGKPAAVVMSPREFDRLTYHQRVVDAVNEGLADIEAGRVYSDDEVFAELEKEFGPIPKPKVAARNRKR
jgi:prevent-host-death family protein